MDRIDMGGNRKQKPSFTLKTPVLSDAELTEIEEREERLRTERRAFYGSE